MENIKKYFESLQEKGGFKDKSFDGLNEEESRELYTNYLSHLEDNQKDLSEKLANSENLNKELKQTLEEENVKLSQEINEYNRKTAELSLEISSKMVESIKHISFESKEEREGKKAIDAVKDFHKTLNQAVKNGEKKTISIDVKTVLNAVKADTFTTSVIDFTRGVEDPNVTRLAHRLLTAYQSIPSKITIPEDQGGTYRYMEQSSANSIRGAAQVAEGAIIPESTILWEKKERRIKKTADQIPYSDEFQYDFRNLMNEIIVFLTQNVNIQVDDQIINGDGTGDNYDGMLASIPAYLPVASGITDANLFDLFCKVAEDITDDEGSKYRPDLIFLNSADIVSTNYMLKKDADNNYIPLAMMTEQKGFIVVENNSLPANQMILGDRRYAHILEDGVVTVRTGVYAGNDAIEGIERILLFTRKNLLIKEEETTGWRTVTDIATALATLETV